MPKKRKFFAFKDKQIAEELKSLVGGGDVSYMEGMGKSPAYILQSPAGGIAAKSGSTVSFAECTVQGITGVSGTTTGTGTLGSAGFSLRVFNLSTTAVGASKTIGAVMMGGWLIAVWEDC